MSLCISTRRINEIFVPHFTTFVPLRYHAFGHNTAGQLTDDVCILGLGLDVQVGRHVARVLDVRLRGRRLAEPSAGHRLGPRAPRHFCAAPKRWPIRGGVRPDCARRRRKVVPVRGQPDAREQRQRYVNRHGVVHTPIFQHPFELNLPGHDRPRATTLTAVAARRLAAMAVLQPIRRQQSRPTIFHFPINRVQRLLVIRLLVSVFYYYCLIIYNYLWQPQ